MPLRPVAKRLCFVLWRQERHCSRRWCFTAASTRCAVRSGARCPFCRRRIFDVDVLPEPNPEQQAMAIQQMRSEIQANAQRELMKEDEQNPGKFHPRTTRVDQLIPLTMTLQLQPHSEDLLDLLRVYVQIKEKEGAKKFANSTGGCSCRPTCTVRTLRPPRSLPRSQSRRPWCCRSTRCPRR